MLDLLVTDATLPDGREHMSIAVQDGRIVEVTPGLTAPAHETVAAGGLLVAPPFCDPHFHMDATLSYGLPRVNASFLLLQARSPVEALRLRATRLQVWRRGQRLATTPATTASLRLGGRPAATQFMP